MSLLIVIDRETLHHGVSSVANKGQVTKPRCAKLNKFDSVLRVVFHIFNTTS